ncbi:hypothetical protein N7U66_08265 [Lacinutrix neustonica]|uniref:Uncharacterized protein n=1 Tax=Lacinutrix neustonica TaxID=2980107 RepID=A0A9E8SI93_9FLAO|nr:hypothetical protein [Lacinutrix neustonica]WAC03470.1 hypothetical protein N7U66_08265 [Lacinutrix neustonica]
MTIDMLYEHPLFFDALESVDSVEKPLYYSFFEQNIRLTKAMTALKESLTASNKTIIELEIKLKEAHLLALHEKWEAEGSKQNIESEILETIKDEFNRFVNKQTKIKSHLLFPKTHHTDYFPSFCSPKKLYKSDELEWTKIKINTPNFKGCLKT